VVFNLGDSPALVIEAEVTDDAFRRPFAGVNLLGTTMRLTLRENGATVPCLCTGITAAKWRLIPNPNRILVGQSEALKEVVFGIVNLGQFYVQEPPGTMHQNPLELIASPWRIVISEPRGTIIAAVRDGAAPTFPVVHMGSLTRTDGMPFSSGDAQNLLDGLHWFLSFAAGQWVAPAFVTGVGATGETLWQEWGTRLVQPIKRLPDGSTNITEKFCPRLSQDSWPFGRGSRGTNHLVPLFIGTCAAARSLPEPMDHSY
jgi:hypothetical protein